MGDEIDRRHFGAVDFSRFRRLLKQETDHLQNLLDSDRMSERGDIVGFELEACIVGEDGHPRAANKKLLQALKNPLVVPELSQFNVELNGSPTALTGNVFSRLHDELMSTWEDCQSTANALNCHLVQIGILPTIEQRLLTSEHMSDMVRFQALNDRLMAIRDGTEIEIRIEGADEELDISHDDVMLEAAATSFQIHLQCKPERAIRDFNAAIVASAPMVALSANSHYLFGKELWSETRIPLFEQAIDIGTRHLNRVYFGSDYVNESLMEVFAANLHDHAILLPFVQAEPLHKFAHLRFQNGTIWRWNRPLIGFDYDGQPHLRIEHRTVPSGPTIKDCVANCAAFVGFVRALVNRATPVEEELPFEIAKQNFYMAATHGLAAEITWTNGKSIKISDVITEELLPAAHDALVAAHVPKEECNLFLGIVNDRVRSGLNGANWQKQWVAKNGRDFPRLTIEYTRLQETNKPVHTWPTP